MLHSQNMHSQYVNKCTLKARKYTATLEDKINVN